MESNQSLKALVYPFNTLSNWRLHSFHSSDDHHFASIGVDGQFPKLRQRAPTLSVLLVSVASLVHIRKMQHQSEIPQVFLQLFSKHLVAFSKNM
jgi:hypothetical protein